MDPLRSSFVHFLLTSLHPYFITSSEAPPLQTQPRSPQPRGRLFGNCSSGHLACAAPGVTLQPTALFPMFEFGRRNAQPQDRACRGPRCFAARFIPCSGPAASAGVNPRSRDREACGARTSRGRPAPPVLPLGRDLYPVSPPGQSDGGSPQGRQILPGPRRAIAGRRAGAAGQRRWPQAQGARKLGGVLYFRISSPRLPANDFSGCERLRPAALPHRVCAPRVFRRSPLPGF